MLMHPDMLLVLAKDHHHKLIAEGDRSRLLSRARQARQARQARKTPAVRAQPTGTLASCEPSAVVPAR